MTTHNSTILFLLLIIFLSIQITFAKRKTWGFVKRQIKKTTDCVKNPVNCVKEQAKTAVDCIKNPLDCVKETSNTVSDVAKETANGIADCAKNPLKCHRDGRDDIIDSAEDVVDAGIDIAGGILDCAKTPLKCIKKNPFWNLLPKCLRDDKPEQCFEVIDDEDIELIGKYAARLQKIASLSFWELGGTLLRIARESHKRVMENCDPDDEKTIDIPLWYKYQKKLPFVTARTLPLKRCQRPKEWLKNIYDVFKECFLADLYNFGPKIVAIWKDIGNVGDEAECQPNDNFAVILKLRMMADTKVYFLSGGGGIGLAFGCKDGELKHKLIFDYEAGVKLQFDPKPLSISLHQNVGFLDEWPSHASNFFADVGNLRVTIGIPKAASMVTAVILNTACQQLMPLAIKEILCGHKIPQTVTMFVDPPKINLEPNEPMFEGFDMIGMSLGWVLEILELKGKAAAGSAVTKSGALKLDKVSAVDKPKTKFTDFTSPSVGLHYGDTHLFGSLPDTQPCEGWPRYDDCQDNPCQNGAKCTDGVNSFTCICVVGYSGTNCEINIDDCAVKPCQNGAKCVDKVAHYLCECVTGYTGTNCEISIEKEDDDITADETTRNSNSSILERDGTDKNKNILENQKEEQSSGANAATNNANSNKLIEMSLPLWCLMMSGAAAILVLLLYVTYILVNKMFFASNGSRKGEKKLKTISENEIVKHQENPMVDENENENADKINDEVPSWTSHRNEDGFVYYNNGERSTWTDHNKNGPRIRRSTLLPTPTVLQVET